MSLLNQGIKPNLFNCSAINTRTENQTSVFHAPVSFKISDHANTPVNNNNAKAINAVSVASTLMKLPNTHKANAMIKIPTITFSAIDICPISSSCSVAHFLALGVSLTVGGYNL